MGRFVKNLGLHSASYTIRLPVGTNTLSSQFPVDGQVRFNSSVSNMEVYYSGAWHGAGLVGRVAISKDSFTGDSSTVVFTMTEMYDPGHEAEILVFTGSVYQNPGVAYTVNGYTLTFTSPPDNGIPVVVLHNFNSTHVQ